MCILKIENTFFTIYIHGQKNYDIRSYRKCSLRSALSLYAGGAETWWIRTEFGAYPATISTHHIHCHVVVVDQLTLLLTGYSWWPDTPGWVNCWRPNPSLGPGGQGGGRTRSRLTRTDSILSFYPGLFFNREVERRCCIRTLRSH